jgi:hypothetical protein
MQIHLGKHPPGVRGLAIGLATAILAVPISASTAEPFLTELEWIYPNPETLRGFRVLFALEPSEMDDPKAVDVGKPARADRFVWSISVPEKSSMWVAVVAVGPSGESGPPSPWRRYDWRPGQGPLATPARPYLVQESTP